MYWKAAVGTGYDELLCSTHNGIVFQFSWSHDGKTLVGAETRDFQGFDIGMLSVKGDHELSPLLNNEGYVEAVPKISPNDRWIAYASNEPGKDEIYVRSFPDANRKRTTVSTTGGISPLWSPDCGELFYLSGDAVMAVSVKTEPSFEMVGAPRVLFRGKYVSPYPIDGTPWDISPDGKRFLMIKPPPAQSETPTEARRNKINIILNWFEYLKKKVPAK